MPQDHNILSKENEKDPKGMKWYPRHIRTAQNSTITSASRFIRDVLSL